MGGDRTMLFYGLDMLYMVCCDFYRRRERNTFKYSGMILLAAIFAFNLLFLGILWDDTSGSEIMKLMEDKLVRVIVLLGLLILFGTTLLLRYTRITNYEEIKNHFNSQSLNKRRIHYLISASYALLSIFVFIGYVVIKALNK